MKLDELTIGEAKQLAKMLSIGTGCDEDVNGPWEIGQKYLIRTGTHYMCGRLVWVGRQELVLEGAAWIGDTGRYSDALKTGVFDEVEPLGREIIGRHFICDAQIWEHDVNLEKK